MLGVFSCVESFWIRTDGAVQHAKYESVGDLKIGAIGYADWLCAAPANQHNVWEGPRD